MTKTLSFRLPLKRVIEIVFACSRTCLGFRVSGLAIRIQGVGYIIEAMKVDVRLPGKDYSNSHGARPVHQIISIIEWIRTSRFSIKKSLSIIEG